MIKNVYIVYLYRIYADLKKILQHILLINVMDYINNTNVFSNVNLEELNSNYHNFLLSKGKVTAASV